MQERIEPLGRVLDALAEPDSPAREDLERDLPAATGLAPSTVRAGLDLAMASWGSTGLRELITNELRDDPPALEATPLLTAVVPAGSIPMPTIEAMLAPLVLGSAAILRPASRDAATARAFARLVAKEDTELGDAIAIVDFPREDGAAWDAFLDADAVIASGNDETIETLRRMTPRDTRLVGYGHRFTLGVVACPAAMTTARAFARDISLWDQLGCLSPIAVFVLGDADGWADALALALEDVGRELPRGAVPISAAAAIHRERAEGEFRGASDGATRVIAGQAWTVVREADAAWRPAPLHRFVRVVPVESAAHLAEVLRPVRGHIATVAILPEEAALVGDLQARQAAPGTCQAPPLDWHHDGKGTLRPLLGLPPLDRFGRSA